jgi:hypothetical protein
MALLKTWIYYDPTGGGAMVPVLASGSSLTVQEDVDLIGYAFFGVTDVDEVVMTVAGDSNWEASGLRLPVSWNSATTFWGPHWFPHKIPMKANSVMTLTSVAGAAPCYLFLYTDDAVAPRYAPPTGVSTGRAMYVTLNSAASGVNTVANTAQYNYATTTITNFSAPRQYKIISVARAAAATGPSLAVGISKGNDQHITWWPIAPLADSMVDYVVLPASGIPDFKAGDRCNIHWLSDATEQPTAAITFAYQP